MNIGQHPTFWAFERESSTIPWGSLTERGTIANFPSKRKRDFWVSERKNDRWIIDARDPRIEKARRFRAIYGNWMTFSFSTLSPGYPRSYAH